MGTLKMARQLNSKEFYSLISLARLGIAMNIFDNNENTSYDVIGDMMHTLGTATIMTGGDENFTAEEANRLRAQYVREKLG
jgi:protein-arginine kinase